jgi:hypothetical protein
MFFRMDHNGFEDWETPFFSEVVIPMWRIFKMFKMGDHEAINEAWRIGAEDWKLAVQDWIARRLPK